MRHSIAVTKFIWTIPFLAIAMLVPTAVVLAGTGQSGFDGVVDSIESRYHIHATRIPLMGLVSLVAGAATHNGVHSVHIAEFEQFTAPVDGQELKLLVDRKLGASWELMVRETSRKGGEQTLIYCHPEGTHMGLFIVDKEDNEMNVVQVSVDPAHLNESIARYEHDDSRNSGDNAVEN